MKNELTEISHLMDTLNVVADKISAYGRTPRQYGTDDLLLVHEVHVIDYIGKYKNVTATDIVTVTYKSKGAVSQTLNKLSEIGLIKKIQDPIDKRKYILILTEKGSIVYEHHRSKDELAYMRYMDRLGKINDSDLSKANEILKIIFKL